MKLDRQLESWLAAQLVEWKQFAHLTDRVRVTPVDDDKAPRRYVAQFDCRGLLRHDNGEVTTFDTFLAAIQFGEDHLSRVDPLRLVWMLSPPGLFHPNVKDSRVCLGHLPPGVGLVDIIYQLYSIVTFQNYNLRSYLNEASAVWVRDHLSELPVDARPLKRREFEIHMMEVEQ